MRMANVTHTQKTNTTAQESPQSLSLYRGDPLFRLLLDRWQVRGQHIVLATIGLGFVMMSLLYLLMTNLYPETRQARSLFEFYSATLGELLLLPIVNYLAIGYCHYVAHKLTFVAESMLPNPEAVRHFLARAGQIYNQHIVTIMLITLVGGVSFLWHLGEIYGPDRNWTLPVRGQINLAGVYHQVFWSFELYLAFFLIYRHLATLRLLLHLTSNTREQKVLAQVSQEICAYFTGILLVWGVFNSLFLTDFYYFRAHLVTKLPGNHSL